MHRKLFEVVVAVGVAAPTMENRTMGSMETQLAQANFDTNMVIIMAALLCALICALGLNSMVRCVLRCGHWFGLETTEQAAVQVSTTGLKKSALRKIPVAVYGADKKDLNTNIDLSVIECPICLGEFMDGEKVRVLPQCNHRFHVSCIDTWLRSHSSCPNCRHSLLEVASPSSKAASGNRHEHVVPVAVEVSGGS